MTDAKNNVQLWFKFARVDLNMAQLLFENGSVKMWRGVTYNYQQAAEKCIKGYLVYKKIKFPKTHDIGSLAVDILVQHPELKPLMQRASLLTKYAVYFRYPSVQEEEITKDHVVEALSCAKNVIEEVISLIPSSGSW